MNKTVRVSISPITIDTQITGAVSMEVDNEKDIRFNYEIDGEKLQMKFQPHMVGDKRYAKIINTLKLRRHVAIESKEDEKPINLITEFIGDIVKDIHNVANFIDKTDTDKLVGELCDIVISEKESIAATLSRAQSLFEGLFFLTKESKHFVEGVNKNDKDKVIALLNTREAKSCKDAIATMYTSLADVGKAIGAYTVVVNDTQEKALTLFESIKAKWNTIHFFRIRRSFKFQLAFTKIVSAFK